MVKPIVLKKNDINKVIQQAIDHKTDINISYLTMGKWKALKGKFTDISSTLVEVQMEHILANCAEILKIEQPIGISFKMEHFRYIFESTVADSICHENIFALELPTKVEKMPRRSYIRASVPENLVVRVILWHRGYNDDKDLIPAENYWQAKLINVSAGGMKVGISPDKKDYFSPGQLIGLQFTPLPYEKPILLEALIRHIEQTEDDIELGFEFLGLEASWQGRTKMRRLAEIVDKYSSADKDKTSDSPQED